MEGTMTLKNERKLEEILKIYKWTNTASYGMRVG